MPGGSRDDVTNQSEPDSTAICIYEVDKPKTAVECLKELVNCIIGHEIGIVESTFDTTIGRVIEYHKTRKLMMGEERIFDNGVVISGEDNFEDIRYLQEGSESVSRRDSNGNGYIIDTESFGVLSGIEMKTFI